MKWCQGLLLTVEKKMTTKRSFCSDIVNIVRKAKHFFVQFLTKKVTFLGKKVITYTNVFLCHVLT